MTISASTRIARLRWHYLGSAVVASGTEMAENRLVVNHVGDSIQLSWQRGQAMPRLAPSVPFEHPFGEQALRYLVKIS